MTKHADGPNRVNDRGLRCPKCDCCDLRVLYTRRTHGRRMQRPPLWASAHDLGGCRRIDRNWLSTKGLQMPTKRVIVLANSIKKQARCVAGREIVRADGNRLGDWIRPVSDSGEGELLSHHYHLDGGGSAQVLDIVDMELQAPKSDPGQPENWLIDETTSWKKVQSFPAAKIHMLEEEPGDLWLDGGASDRISIAAQSARSPQSSLAIVRPRNLRIRLWREFNPWKNYTQRKSHALFEYAGEAYDLSLTDPVFSARHCASHPAENEPAREFAPPCGDDCLLCISLTPPFNGEHYKVVATVLECT